jgi:hypothetical protein
MFWPQRVSMSAPARTFDQETVCVCGGRNGLSWPGALKSHEACARVEANG